MTAPVLRRRGQSAQDDDASSKARLFLALACFWPILVMVLFVLGSDSSSSSVDNNAVAGTNSNSSMARVVNPGLSFRKYMDRVDIMGYGPTHPRVAIVVVGDDRAKIISSVESVLR